MWSEVSYTGSPIALSINQAGELIVGDNNTRIYRSTDNGTTWVQTGDLDWGIHSIESRNGKMSASTSLISSDHGQTVARGSFYYSTNNGASWVSKLTGLSVTKMHLTESGVIFANVSTSTPVTNQIRRSTNEGTSWDILTLPPGAGGYSGVSSAGGKIFVTSSNGIYSSPDNGITWTPSFTGGGCNFIQSDNSGNLFAINYAINSSVVTYSLIKSTDQGLTWTNVAPMTGFFIKEFSFPASGKMFTASNMGVFVSTTGGGTWEVKNNGINANPVLDLKHSNGRLFAVSGSGNYFSNNNGNTWSLLNTIGTVTGLQGFITIAGNIFSYNDQRIYRSQNNGDSWTEIWNDSLPDIYTKVIATTNGILMFGAFGADIYRSTNAGTSWELAYDGLTTSSGLSCLAPGLNGEVFAGVQFSNGTGLLVSTNNGSNWSTRFEDETFMMQFRSITALPAGLFLNNFTSLRRSTDNGVTWHDANTGLTGDLYHSKPLTNADGKLYLNTGGGVFVSTDGGLNWAPVNTGLTSPLTYSICLNDDQRLFAGTGMGVFRSATPTGISGTSEIPGSFKLEQNYPNPFNPNTRINYELQITNYVKLSVYDVNGKLIRILVNERKNAGSYNVELDGTSLASGIYFYKLQAGEFSDVKRMVLVK